MRSFGLKTFIKERNSVDALYPSRLSKSTGTVVITRGKNQYNDVISFSIIKAALIIDQLFNECILVWSQLLSVLSTDQVTYVNSNLYTDQIIEVLDYFKIAIHPSDCHRICFVSGEYNIRVSSTWLIEFIHLVSSAIITCSSKRQKNSYINLFSVGVIKNQRC